MAQLESATLNFALYASVSSCRNDVLLGNLELILQILTLKDSYRNKYLYRMKMSETYLTRTLSTYTTKIQNIIYCNIMIVEELVFVS